MNNKEILDKLYTLRLYGEELKYRYLSQEEIIRAIDRWGADVTR